MLVLWLAGLLSLSPILGGLITQQEASLVFFLAVLILGIEISRRVWNDAAQMPPIPLLLWAIFLSLISFVSAFLSPIPVQALIAWRSLVLGLWIIPLLSPLSPSARAKIDQAIFFSVYILCAYAAVQIFIFRHLEVASFFPNANIFASFIVLLLPLAWEQKRVFLAACLTLMLLATKSVGAWFSLATAALIFQKQMPRKIKLLAFFIFTLCLVLIAKKPAFDFQNRWMWWQAALRAIAQRPWLGVGPGVLTYIIPVELSGHLLRSIYAHQFYLQTAAECGMPYLIVFLAGIFLILPKAPMKRLAIVAALILGFWDYSLSVPAIFFIFCYLAASEVSQPPELNPLGNFRFPLAIFILILTAILVKPAWARWNEERLKVEGISLFNRHAPIAEVRQEFLKSLLWAPDADVERLVAEIDFRSSQEKSPHSQLELLSAIRHWKKAAQENPCRASNWKALSSLEQISGNPTEAQSDSLKALHLPCP